MIKFSKIATSIGASVNFGAVHSLLLDTQGDLWVWRANGSGQLGDGTTENSSVPKQISQ